MQFVIDAACPRGLSRSNNQRRNLMVMKSTKATRKKLPGKVRDLAARKDPKGGAQKKEGPAMARNARGGTTLRAGKSKLS